MPPANETVQAAYFWQNNKDWIIPMMTIGFGWLLGLMTNPVVSALKKKKQRKEVLNTLKIELATLQYRLAVMAYSLAEYLRKIDKDFLDWLFPTIESYETKYNDEKEGLTNHIKNLLALSEIDLIAHYKAFDRMVNFPGRAKMLRKYSVPFMDNVIHQLSILKSEILLQMVEIRAQIELYHDHIDNWRHFFDLTFDPSISGDNRQSVENNLDKCFLDTLNRAKIIIKLISKLNIK